MYVAVGGELAPVATCVYRVGRRKIRFSPNILQRWSFLCCAIAAVIDAGAQHIHAAV